VSRIGSSHPLNSNSLNAALTLFAVNLQADAAVSFGSK
jgi:hypothetical protein